jgi:hypothetical protein
LEFRLPIASGNDTVGTIEKFDPENMGITVGSLFLASLEAEIHQGEVLPPPLVTNGCKITLVI